MGPWVWFQVRGVTFTAFSAESNPTSSDGQVVHLDNGPQTFLARSSLGVWRKRCNTWLTCCGWLNHWLDVDNIAGRHVTDLAGSGFLASTCAANLRDLIIIGDSNLQLRHTSN